MKKYKILKNGYKDNELKMFIPNDPENRHYKMVQKWITEGNIPDPEYTDEEIIENEKSIQIKNIIKEYNEDINKPVECIVNGVTYYMDGLEESATKMKHGIEYAELMNLTKMDIVDYYNKIHENISLDDCREIMLQQATAYITNWKKKSLDRNVVLNS